MRKIIKGIALLSILSLASCAKEDTNGTANLTSQSKVSFLLTDAPSLQGYKSVKVDVQKIEYSIDGTTWIALPMSPTVYDLLELTNGKTALLSNIVLEKGNKVSQVRLILGDNNSVTLADGTVKTIKAPSAETSGLKINIQGEITTTSGYSLMLDFDAERSIVKKGNGDYSLKPTLRGFVVENMGSFSGKITPADKSYQVYVVVGTDTINTISDVSQNNYYKIQGLKSGSYSVEFRDPKTSLNPIKKVPVDVLGGSDKDMGTVSLAQ